MPWKELVRTWRPPDCVAMIGAKQEKKFVLRKRTFVSSFLPSSTTLPPPAMRPPANSTSNSVSPARQDPVAQHHSRKGQKVPHNSPIKLGPIPKARSWLDTTTSNRFQALEVHQAHQPAAVIERAPNFTTCSGDQKPGRLHVRSSRKTHHSERNQVQPLPGL